ncbi:hypothetical protein COL922a_003741 [Colletotrichum nupharicola]|nr:hypothetical protein COL922a_003741 [Colletotrichum nupharicola]
MRPLANPKGHPKYPFNSPGSPSSIPSSQASVTLARNRPSRLPPPAVVDHLGHLRKQEEVPQQDPRGVVSGRAEAHEVVAAHLAEAVVHCRELEKTGQKHSQSSDPAIASPTTLFIPARYSTSHTLPHSAPTSRRLPTNPSKTSRRSASLTSSSLGALLGCWSGCSRDRKPET